MINQFLRKQAVLLSDVSFLVPRWHFSCLWDHWLDIGVRFSPLIRAHKLSKMRTETGAHHAGHRYNFYVARGWESKSVEEQQAQAVSIPGPAKLPLTPAQIASQRRRQGLMLSRQYVLRQLEAVQNPRHREILQGALADLDTQLAQSV